MIDALLAWCSANRIWIDPRIGVRSPESLPDTEARSDESGISVFATDVIPNATAGNSIHVVERFHFH